MQITIRSTRVIKEGEQKNGTPYKWVSVIADDGSEKGTEYTTFDTSVLHHAPGTIIDIGDPKTKGGKLSFEKVVSVVQEGKPVEDKPATSAGYKRDTGAIKLEYELKAHLQAVERVSIEAQTAYNGIIAALNAGKIPLDDSVVTQALEWAIKAIGGIATEPIEPVKTESDKLWDEIKRDDIPEFTTGPELVNYAMKQGMKLDNIKTTLGINNPTEIKDVKAASVVLFGKPKEIEP